MRVVVVQGKLVMEPILGRITEDGTEKQRWMGSR